MKNSLILLSIVFTFGIIIFEGCDNTPQEEQKLDVANSPQNDVSALNLISKNCFACHSPDADCENRVAPPMFKIREHYWDDSISKEEFVSQIANYVNNPSDSLSRMPGAVRNFGLMPKMNFKEEDIKSIAEYLYDNDVSSDEWYNEWEQFKTSSHESVLELNYEDIARDFANQAKAELGKNLLQAIKEKGTAGAVEFCNTKAIAITDSMSLALNAKVKRVSDKPRNPLNQADEEEKVYIEKLKVAISKGEKLEPMLIEKKDKVLAYFSIETNAMCLQCHGTPNKSILPETMDKLKKLYPNDKATGYGENEVRGLFVVEIDKK